MKAALHQDAASSQFEHRLNFPVNLLKAQDVPFRRSGLAVKGTERTDGRTDVTVVNITIDDVGDDVVRMQAPAKPVRQLLNGFERRLFGELKVLRPAEVITLFYSFGELSNAHLQVLTSSIERND